MGEAHEAGESSSSRPAMMIDVGITKKPGTRRAAPCVMEPCASVRAALAMSHEPCDAIAMKFIT